MPKKLISLKLDEELKQRAQERADALGMSMTELIARATEFFVGFDDKVWNVLQEMSKDFQIRDTLFLQNTFIDWSARRTAIERLGRKGSDLFPEFMMSSDGAVTGFKLFENLVYFHLYEQSDTPAPTSEEPDELEIRIQQCRRKADLLRIRRAEEKGLIPKDTIPSPTVARLVERHEKGKINDEELKRKVAHYKREAGWK